MYRLFNTSQQRRQNYLSGRWDFIIDPDDIGKKEKYYLEFPQKESDDLHVPSAWNSYPQYYDYEGIAWYQKKFYLPEKTNIRLYFGAVAHDAEVYLDGKKLGSHYGGFTPFDFMLPQLNSGSHKLVVRVDNTHGQNTIPKADVDWYHYGGITRTVFIEEVGSVIIDNLKIAYDLNLKQRRAEVNLDLTLYNFKRSNKGSNNNYGTTENLKIYLNNELKWEDSFKVPPGKSNVSCEFLLDKIELWSPEKPKLYDIRVEIDADDFRERTGFRKINTEGKQILLNGEPVEIKGVNRHEDHPDWGLGLPPRLIKQDIDILKELGVNAVRTSHYPNNPVFLDYCDREGILVLEEIPYWQFSAEDFSREIVLRRGKQMLEEMIDRDYNHPALYAWSVHNECENYKEGLYKPTAELVSLVRKKDASRPVTYASHTDFLQKEDLCFDLIDFLCINGYYGWYSDELTWEEFIARLHNENPDKPIIISEFGAGAVKNERTLYNQKWSEGYQADLLEDTINTFLDSEYITGFYIWQYCDTRTAVEKVMGRPKQINNKGIVDAYRRPKDAYYRVKKILNKNKKK